jgi:MFS family permease
LCLFIGVVYDVIGRKMPVLIFLVLMGLSIIVMPFFKDIYPGYVILRAFV